MSDPQRDQAVRLALVEEAARRSSVLWLDYAGLDRARPAWHVWKDGAAYVVTDAGEGAAGNAPAGAEQSLPGLAGVSSATVSCRSKDSGARLVCWRAAVERLAPGTPDWDDALRALRADRLNAADAPGLAARWAESAAIVRLTPTGEVLEAPGSMPADRVAAPPPASPATTTGRLPWVVHKRPRRRPRLS